MKFSIVATFSGHSRSSYELTVADLRRSLKEFESRGLSFDITQPGNSEYEYLGRENHDIEFETDDKDKWFYTVSGTECSERFEDEEEAREHAASALREPWLLAQDITVSGIVDKDTFKDFIDAIGAWADNTETMGTLGGPLAPWGGIVADISFRMEEQCIIESIRVTPIPERKGEPMQGDERTWDRVRKATLSVFGN